MAALCACPRYCSLQATSREYSTYSCRNQQEISSQAKAGKEAQDYIQFGVGAQEEGSSQAKSRQAISREYSICSCRNQKNNNKSSRRRQASPRLHSVWSHTRRRRVEPGKKQTITQGVFSLLLQVATKSQARQKQASHLKRIFTMLRQDSQAKHKQSAGLCVQSTAGGFCTSCQAVHQHEEVAVTLGTLKALVLFLASFGMFPA